MFTAPNDFCMSTLVCSGLDVVDQKNIALQFIVSKGLGYEFTQFIEEALEEEQEAPIL